MAAKYMRIGGQYTFEWREHFLSSATQVSVAKWWSCCFGGLASEYTCVPTTVIGLPLQQLSSQYPYALFRSLAFIRSPFYVKFRRWMEPTVRPLSAH